MSTKNQRQNLLNSTPDSSSTSDIKIGIFHKGYYLNENTMQIYKGQPQPNR